MTLTELKYCVELAKTRHFRKASENCYVSQPTLSVAIKKLEEELNVTLFERRKNDVILTPIGKQVIEIAENILKQSQMIQQIAKDEFSEVSEVNIGAIYTIGPYLLPSVIKQLNQHAPQVRLTVEENYTHELAKKLQSGELDIILVAEPFDDKNIEKITLYEEPFVAALPVHHKMAIESEIDLKKIEEDVVFLLGAGHCFRDQVLEAYPNLNHSGYQSHPLQKTLEGSSLETIRYMVASGAGLTILPCTAAQENNNELLIYKPLTAPTPKRTVIMAWRKSFPRTKLLKLFQELLLSIQLPCTTKN
ncbi:hydrogen peroxide-inducible genes activator [Hydrogenovibrio sp. JE_KL2]|uniref:hydrogen peroxide-inducible genes activator n=1 Tax=Hydrogenovibrio sp. JE_KL2 TaxID=2651188 RepID=UPI00128D32D3|nr:hydrogen peroxide-inducible genes activator [Hydrogenovibrio sp. JE_KL2]MPQ76569.1 LysR family transcriptional regulator [Hydrogenovibrio sp. JE_KL2]